MWNMSESPVYNESGDTISGYKLSSRDDQYVSDSVRKIVFLVNHVVIDMCICIFGIVGNCTNIRVFVKQGLQKSVNLSLCAMSFSDLVGLVFQVWHNFCLNPYLELVDWPVDFMQIQVLTGGCPNVAMTRITGWITMYITMERCLSVLMPLKIRRIVTFKRTAVILVFCYLINLSVFVPLYAADYMDWINSPSVNRTKLGVARYGNSATIGLVMNVGHFYLSVLSFLFVVIFTAVLVVALKKKTKWRLGATSDREQHEALTSRDNKVVGMVIMVAIVLILCYSPGVLCSIVEICIPEFTLNSKLENLYHVVWSVCFVCNSVNASTSVVVYYTMSTKYRSTLQEIYPILKTKDKLNSN
ncbi:neuropeptides capa receptor [Biomphalaria glabrata]|nr:neuropeptides capa receptor-like [Biomphalaria glabrata]